MNRRLRKEAATPHVKVPACLLLSPELIPSAKVIWMVIRLYGQLSPGQLQERTGLSRPTVLRGLARVGDTSERARADRDEGAKGGGSIGEWADVPGELLEDPRIGAQAKVLYGVLQLIPAFQNQAGRFTYDELSTVMGVSRNTVKRAVRELAQSGWIKVAQANRLAPVAFMLANPVVESRLAAVEAARLRLEEAPFLGEALMREYLTLLVDSDEFEDDAAPGFLVNPLTDERLELDRYYPPNVAFEFNGPQHYGPTARFSKEESFRQQARDYMKLGICTARGIRLVVVHPEDLSLDGMRRKVEGLLPLRDLRGQEALIALLESVSRRYRRAARRQR